MIFQDLFKLLAKFFELVGQDFELSGLGGSDLVFLSDCPMDLPKGSPPGTAPNTLR